jgi:transcriptional regulator with XRE-family HTH domain
MDAEEDGAMRESERDLARRRLDKELRYYRLAGKERRPTQELLRRVRQVLGLPSAEVARAMGVNRSVLFRLEGSEARGTISLRAMTRVAQAMGCQVVYALIPSDGTTLEEMADRRKWMKRLKVEQ